jgi:hypothetical protein
MHGIPSFVTCKGFRDLHIAVGPLQPQDMLGVAFVAFLLQLIMLLDSIVNNVPDQYLWAALTKGWVRDVLGAGLGGSNSGRGSIPIDLPHGGVEGRFLGLFGRRTRGRLRVSAFMDRS